MGESIRVYVGEEERGGKEEEGRKGLGKQTVVEGEGGNHERR